jgi:hypothetical protein
MKEIVEGFRRAARPPLARGEGAVNSNKTIVNSLVTPFVLSWTDEKSPIIAKLLPLSIA